MMSSSTNVNGNMYKISDYVFFEVSSSAPYQIRRIEELIKTPNGSVEAKVMCFYRRRDIPSTLIQLADKHQSALEEEQEEEVDQLTEKQRQQLKQRELFLSRQVETLPATHIRGKCTVTLLNETESLASYLDKEDTFFYSLVYDPVQKTLLADRGEIRVGSRFQADSIPKSVDPDILQTDDRDSSILEVLEFTPNHGVSDDQIEQFLIVAKSVGTFARALDHSSSVKQPSLHMSAAAASRDVTISHAMKVLHRNEYHIGNAVLDLVPPNGPLLCRDEMEEWSASEANLFEEAIEKYGKDFSDIRQDFLPWKSLRNIIEYYYMWKTTDRYVQQKRVKAVEAESKLKQVYIPNYNSSNSNKQGGIVNGGPLQLTQDALVGSPATGRPCESCGKSISSQWYAWGQAQVQCRLCQACWTYWKKFAGLKYTCKVDVEKLSVGRVTGDSRITGDARITGDSGQGGSYPCSECSKVFNRQERLVAHMAGHRPHRCPQPGCGKEFKFKAHLVRHCAQAHGLHLRSGSPRPIMKTRAAFYLATNQAARVGRRVCTSLFRKRHAARRPFEPINVSAVKQECFLRFAADGIAPILPKLKPFFRGTVADVSHKLGTPVQEVPEWLIPAPKDSLPQPERLAFIPPPRGEDGQFIIPRPEPCRDPSPTCELKLDAGTTSDTQSTKNLWGINNVSPSLSKKRPYEQTNGDGSAPSKRRQLAPTNLLTGKNHDLYALSGLPRGSLINPQNGRQKVATVTRIAGRKPLINWVDAPDDVFFIANTVTRRLRRQLVPSDLKRGARRPWKKIPTKSLMVNNHNFPNLNNLVSSNGNGNNNNNDLSADEMMMQVAD